MFLDKLYFVLCEAKAAGLNKNHFMRAKEQSYIALDLLESRL
jgi:hypothetical protein